MLTGIRTFSNDPFSHADSLAPTLMFTHPMESPDSDVFGTEAWHHDCADLSSVEYSAKAVAQMQPDQAAQSFPHSPRAQPLCIVPGALSFQDDTELAYTLSSLGQILYASPSITANLGYQVHELVLEYFVNFIHEDDQSQFFKTFTQAIEHRETFVHSYRFRQHDGKFRFVETMGQVRPGASWDVGHNHNLANEHVELRICCESPGSGTELSFEQSTVASQSDPESPRCPMHSSPYKLPQLAQSGSASTTSVPRATKLKKAMPKLMSYHTFPPPSQQSAAYRQYESCQTPDSSFATNYTPANQRRPIRRGTSHGVTKPLQSGAQSHGGANNQACDFDFPAGAGNLPRNKTKKPRQDIGPRLCVDCGLTSSPEWRRGPSGPKSLCNACGLRLSKLKRKAAEEVENHAQESRRLSDPGYSHSENVAGSPDIAAPSGFAT